MDIGELASAITQYKPTTEERVVWACASLITAFQALSYRQGPDIAAAKTYASDALEQLKAIEPK